MSDQSIVFSPSNKQFMTATQPLKVIVGAVGSGKTTLSIFTIIWHSMQQPLVNGVRRAKCVVVRNTRPQLESTVISSLVSLFPSIVISRGSPITGILTITGSDGTTTIIEFVFIATAIAKSEEKFLGLEATMIYINEGNKLLRSLFVTALDRHGRYPSQIHGGVNWHGVIIDCNSFPSTEWMYKDLLNELELETPYNGDLISTDDKLIIRQPPAVIEFNDLTSALNSANGSPVVKSLDSYFYHINPLAPNLKVLKSSYYLNNIPFKTSKFVRLRLMNHFIDVENESLLCYPEFNPYSHIKDIAIPPEKVKMYLLGWDFGLDPSCAIIICDTSNLFYVVGEVCQHNCGVERALPFVFEKLEGLGIDYRETISFIDPSGFARAQSNEYRCSQVLISNGFKMGGTVTQNFMSRLVAVRELLYKPGDFYIHSSCVNLIKGFTSTFHFKEGAEKYKVDKTSKENHIHDALQYGALGFKSYSKTQLTIPNF